MPLLVYVVEGGTDFGKTPTDPSGGIICFPGISFFGVYIFLGGVIAAQNTWCTLAFTCGAFLVCHCDALPGSQSVLSE